MKQFDTYNEDVAYGEMHRKGETALQLAKELSEKGRLAETYCFLKIHCKSCEIDLFGMNLLQIVARKKRDRLWENVRLLESVFGEDTEERIIKCKQKVKNLTAMIYLFEYLRETHRYQYRGNKLSPKS